MPKNILPCLALTILFNTALQAQSFDTLSLKKHIQYLASDDLKGRATASVEEQKAADYIANEFKTLGLQPKGDKNSYFQAFKFKPSDPHGNIDSNAVEEHSKNVVGFLDNHALYTVIIGAHYDHLGLGKDHNSLEANSEGQIHNGADDNASGVAGLIELASALSNNKITEKYNFIFIAFSGEELGLIGSKRFCENPTIDLKTAHYMINMDMIGRLNAEKKLVVGGVGTAPDFVPALNAFKNPSISIKQDSSGIGPSDHTSFYLKNIPVLFFFTGQHADYHKPSDDAEKINYAGEKAVLEYIYSLIMDLDAAPKLVFQETKSKKEDTPSFKVTLGIMPDYIYEGKGIHVDGVTQGRPASRAGILKGDIILQLGTYETLNMQDYMKALSKFEKGNTTKVKVKRQNEELLLDISF